jgi:hypothetical protein
MRVEDSRRCGWPRRRLYAWGVSVSASGLGLLLVALIAAQAAAYDHPLNSSAIRDAYFLGSDNNQSVRFLAGYKETLPAPKSGPHVAEIEVRTPFAQVVVSSREHSVGYSAQQAEQDYKKNPGTLQVRIQILFTATFAIGSPLNPPPACQGVIRMNSALDCFHDFQFRSRQEKQIEPVSSYGVPIYSGGDSSVLTGGDIWFTFRTDEIASAPLRVAVSTPDGQKISAEFDLAALR